MGGLHCHLCCMLLKQLRAGAGRVMGHLGCLMTSSCQLLCIHVHEGLPPVNVCLA